MRFEEPILVTRPYLPPLDEFKTGLEEIWRNRWLTNNGPVAQRFASALSGRLGIPESSLALFCNGTLALELGFYAMGLEGGEVVTTPFTFVATSHALRRIGARPVFADIDPDTFCLSSQAAERMITSRTKAIVPVHVYGIPCDVSGFSQLGEGCGVKIIYDAAHAFGAELGGRSIACCGDMAMFSFHPTKIFHSCEGGMLVFRDQSLQEKLFNLRNFAIRSETECVDVGTNAKMKELQALMGLQCLRKFDEILSWRRRIYAKYAESFADCSDVRLIHGSANKAYIPVLFRDNETRERVYNTLKERHNVFTRRYFWPILTDFAPYAYARGTCPVAEEMSSRVLTLPTYHGLSLEAVETIAKLVKDIAG